MTDVLSDGTALSRSSTAEELARILGDLILTGALTVGHPMREIALAAQYDVSRRTVREALSLLQHAGLVRHHRHRGTRVTTLTEDDIHDLYRVRLTLEGAAAAACVDAAPDRQEALRQAYERLARATRGGDAVEIVARDLDFHQAVVGLLGSERVDGFFAAIALEMRHALSILEASYQESKRRPKAALREHRAIRDALLARDTALASTLVREHIAINEKLLAAAVDRR